MEKHRALRWLIHGTGAAIVLICGSFGLIMTLGLVFALFFHMPNEHNVAYKIAVFAFGGACAAFYCLCALIGWRMFRRTDETTLANFSFLFSAIASVAFFKSFRHGLSIGNLSLLENANVPFWNYGSSPGHIDIAYGESLLFLLAVALFFASYYALKHFLIHRLISNKISVIGR